ncbi:MAG: S1 family peptidase [Actinomycetota bacterium]
MRRMLIAALSALTLALPLAGPAGAITFGEPDGERHPSVAAILNDVAFSDGTWALCSGTLISPTVVLTAAHCDDERDRVAVTFDSVYDPKKGTEHWGTWHPHPGFTFSQDDPHDIAVIVLDKPVKGIPPSRLPAADSLSNLSGSQQFTSVGYGAQSVTQGGGPKVLHFADIRFMAVGTLNSINSAWLRISMNPAKGDGGTCYGDSGGPNFLGAGATETNVVAATTITGDVWCRSTNVTYRVDTPVAREFLGQFVTLP